VTACPPVCGSCAACVPLVWVLGQLARQTVNARILAGKVKVGRRPPAGIELDRYLAMRALQDPAERAELFARALRGRGVELCCTHTDEAPGECVDPRHWADLRPQTCAALERLLAAGLCGPEEPLRLLGVRP